MSKRIELRVDAIVGAAALLVIALLGFIRAQGHAPQVSAPSSYDYGPAGYAAIYELLQREDVNVSRFERSHLLLSHEIAALDLAQVPYSLLFGGGLSRGDVTALKNWVAGGGTLIVLSPPYGDAGDKLLGIPATRNLKQPARRALAFAEVPLTTEVKGVSGNFAVEFDDRAASKAFPILVTSTGVVALKYQLGKGAVVALTDPSIFSNTRLREPDNARFAFNLLGAFRTVAFDETVHGFTGGTSLWSALPLTARLAAIVTLATIILAVIGNLFRFVPPLPLAEADEPDSSAYLTAMANLLESAGARARALHDRADFTLRRVRASVGLSDRAPISEVLSRISPGRSQDDIAEVDRLTRLEDPTQADLIKAGVLSSRLQNEFQR
jgi:hypothetical protein